MLLSYNPQSRLYNLKLTSLFRHNSQPIYENQLLNPIMYLQPIQQLSGSLLRYFEAGCNLPCDL